MNIYNIIITNIIKIIYPTESWLMIQLVKKVKRSFKMMPPIRVTMILKDFIQ